MLFLSENILLENRLLLICVLIQNDYLIIYVFLLFVFSVLTKRLLYETKYGITKHIFELMQKMLVQKNIVLDIPFKICFNVVLFCFVHILYISFFSVIMI